MTTEITNAVVYVTTRLNIPPNVVTHLAPAGTTLDATEERIELAVKDDLASFMTYAEGDPDIEVIL